MKMIKSSFNRLLALALVLMLAFTAAVPVFAASGDNLTITIRNNKGLPEMTDNQFAAYQLFKGTPYQEDDTEHKNVTENDWNASNWNNYTLADIEWGDGVNGSNLLFALKALSYDTDNENWSEFFDADKENANVFANIDSAAQLAELLVGKSNAFLQKFSKFVVKGSGKEGSSGFLTSSAAKSIVTEETKSLEAIKQQSIIQVNNPGYYLIVEEGDHNIADAVSEYILAVLGNQEIDLKASAPTVDKNIVSGDDLLKGDVAGISDTVTFELTGDLSKNFMDFNTYEYIFTDTLSKGLTYAGNMVVTVLQGGVTYTIASSEYTVTPASANTDEVPAADTLITVTFENLRKESGLSFTTRNPLEEPASGKIVLDESAKIYVTYDAVVNENAVIGSVGNPNDVNLTYSNDPNTNDKGKTEDKRVYVYAFGLDLVKVGSDAAHDDEGLPGAGFTLKNSQEKYAQFEDATDSEGNAIRRLVNWVDASTVDDLISEYNAAKEAYNKAANNDEKAATKNTLDDKAKALESYLLTSKEKGKIPNVTGLDEGKYTLTEIITPDGYNTMDPFWFQIRATFAESGKLESVIYVPMIGKFQTYTATSTNAGETSPGAVFSSGLLPETLTNIKAPFLPFTGGMGIILFYILGGLLIAGAVIYIVVSAKKRNKKEENI